MFRAISTVLGVSVRAKSEQAVILTIAGNSRRTECAFFYKFYNLCGS